MSAPIYGRFVKALGTSGAPFLSFLFSGRWRASTDRSASESAVSLGPFGLLFRYEGETGVSVKARFLLIFGYGSSEEGVTLDVLGIPVY